MRHHNHYQAFEKVNSADWKLQFSVSGVLRYLSVAND